MRDVVIFLQYKSRYQCYSDREHPEIQKVDFEEYYETENQRELRQIFNGQSQMFDALRELHRKLDEIVGRQERVLGLISQIGQGGTSLILQLNYNLYRNNSIYRLIRSKCMFRCTSYGPTRTTTCVDRHHTSAGSRRCAE